MTEQRLLYFSIGTFAPTPHALGGNIYGKNLVQRLTEDKNIRLFVVNANDERHREGTEAFFRLLGVDLLFIPIGPMSLRPERRTLSATASLMWKTLFRLQYEMEAYNQRHIAESAEWAVRHWKIEHVLVDYVPAVLYWPSIIDLDILKTIATVNREADLYSEMLSLGLFPHGPLTGRISHWRLSRFERRVYRAFDKVIAIGAPDVPSYLPPNRTAVITSYLDESPDRWSPRGNRTIFFVGNVAHYPNRLAVDHIVAELAPLVLARVPDAEFVIVGASNEHVADHFRRPGIKLLGASTPDAVKELFTSSALFICPVRNTFGMKFKVAEAAAYGTPLLASEQTMLGFPYLCGIPELTLDAPSKSAELIADLIIDPDKQRALSADISRRLRAFAETQENIWSRTLFNNIKADY